MFLRPLPIVVSRFSFPVEKAAGEAPPPLPQGSSLAFMLDSQSPWQLKVLVTCIKL